MIKPLAPFDFIELGFVVKRISYRIHEFHRFYGLKFSQINQIEQIFLLENAKGAKKLNHYAVF